MTEGFFYNEWMFTSDGACAPPPRPPAKHTFLQKQASLEMLIFLRRGAKHQIHPLIREREQPPVCESPDKCDYGGWNMKIIAAPLGGRPSAAHHGAFFCRIISLLNPHQAHVANQDFVIRVREGAPRLRSDIYERSGEVEGRSAA